MSKSPAVPMALTIPNRHDVSVIVSDQRMPKKTGSELLASERVYSLLISDQRMPVMTGAERLARVASISPATSRILLTGYANIEAVIEAVNHRNYQAHRRCCRIRPFKEILL